jgi:hypothetical protein
MTMSPKQRLQEVFQLSVMEYVKSTPRAMEFLRVVKPKSPENDIILSFFIEVNGGLRTFCNVVRKQLCAKSKEFPELEQFVDFVSNGRTDDKSDKFARLAYSRILKVL